MNSTENLAQRSTPGSSPNTSAHGKCPGGFSRIFPTILITLAFGIIMIALFYGWKTVKTAEKIQFENPDVPPAHYSIASLFPDEKRVALRGEPDGRINILLLGRAGEHYPGKNLTDTVMIMSIDTAARRIGFLSLPRDLYSPIPGSTLYTKLNSLYQYGLNSGNDMGLMTDTVTEITGLPIHYFVILDFDGFEKIIDTVGGIRINAERDFLDTRYPGKNYSYETFQLSKGWHSLDGATALKYVRERHADPEGDFGRAKRQQETIRAVRDKVFSIPTFLNPVMISRLLDALGDSVKTDLSLDELRSLAELGKTIDTANPANAVVDAWRKESLLRVSHIDVGGIAAFILVPRTGNWNEIHALAADLFELDTRKAREDAIGREQPALSIIARPENTTEANRFKKLLSETYPVASVTVTISPSLEKRPVGGIMDRTNLGKPFTFDELLKVYALERLATGQALPPSGKSSLTDADFVVLFGDNLKDAGKTEETLEQGGIEDTADQFSEFLPPQQKK